MAALTNLKIKTAKPGRYSDSGKEGVRGLMLDVSPTGGRSFVLRIQRDGRRRDLGLGGWPDIELAEAREKARTMRRALLSGGDAVAVRDKAKVTIPTFEQAAREALDARKAGWSDRTAKNFLATLEANAFARIGNRRVDTIDETDILSVLLPLWTTKPALARKLRHWIGLVLDYSKGRKWRSTGSPRDGLRPLLSKQASGRNFAAMPYVGSSRVDLQACKLEYSIVSPK